MRNQEFCGKRFMMEMNDRFKQSLRWLLALSTTQLALTSCAIGQPMYYYHSFDFHTGTDAKVYGKPDIDVLNYEYGSSGQFGTRPSKDEWEMHAEHGRDSFSSGDVAGMMPRGEYLYVKWRIKATGEIFEDKVDLTRRLPADMTNQGLHFAIYGSQLYVFLFPPEKAYDSRNSMIPGHPPGRERDVPYYLPDIPYAREHQIYPDIKK